jgi:integrase
MLNFAVEHDWIDANPAAHIKKPTPETSRTRVLTDDEIRRVWRILSNLPTTADRPAPGRKRATGSKDDPLCPIHARFAALLKIRMLTAQRGGETARMRWSHLDLGAGWWTIPASDAKNGETHRVPLVADAVSIITALEPKADERKADDYVFLRGDVLVRAKNSPSVVARALDIDFRGHDLRRTAATRMAAAGIPRDHISRVLNHVEGGPRATAVYDRHTYDREKQIALETWARTLKGILEQTEDTGTVRPFARTSQ